MKRTMALAALVLLASGAAHTGAVAVYDPIGSGILPSYDEYGILRRPAFPNDASMMPPDWRPQQFPPLPPPTPATPCRQIDNCAPPLPTIVNPGPIKPPPEYDYPFKGKLYISAENDFAQMIVGCQWTLPYRDIHACARPPGWDTPGIGRMKPNECMILLAKRKLIEGVHDYDMVIRHENAHCNGWRH